MFKHLLVPLDGSHLAEAVLPAVSFLAQKLRVPITLTHVIERDAPRKIHGEPHLANEEEAYAYLDQVAARAFAAKLRVECHVHLVGQYHPQGIEPTPRAVAVGSGR